MGVGHTFAMALEGLEGLVVRVECDLGLGLPGISVIGMGDAAVVQARDRVRAALNNSGLQWPGQRVVMSLSPAGVPKTGAGYDLAMVCAMLVAKEMGPSTQDWMESTVLIGELGLDGRLRAVPGVLPIIVAARRRGFRRVVVPQANAAEAHQAADMVEGIIVLVADTLLEVVEWMRTRAGLLEVREFISLLGGVEQLGQAAQSEQEAGDMADVVSQPEARRVVEIAAAGGHALLLLGPPGSGKSMLAQRLPGILPPMSTAEKMEAAALHSIAGQKGNMEGIFAGNRPFVAPHHTVSQAGLIGGGARPVPGAVSLAHHGVLFIDEIAEVARPVLDTLRVPMESHRVELLRQRRSVRFPAQFQLVCAANPCPCGAEFDADCTCPSGARARYQAKLSGPLRERIDVFARTRSNKLAVLKEGGEETTDIIRERVCLADDRARARWRGVERKESERDWVNATVPGTTLRRDFPAEDAGMYALQDMLRGGGLSQRGIDRALRVSWTLCDLRGGKQPTIGDVLDAVELYSVDN
ncbi:YifB family Mg chelatase-like AAA ATPase [Corynebacterium urogenitale]